MAKLVFIALVGVACVLVAECNEELKALVKEKLKSHFCENKNRESFMKCMDMATEEFKKLMKEETETEETEKAFDKVCESKEVCDKVCDALKEKEDQLGFTDDLVKNMMDCLENMKD